MIAEGVRDALQLDEVWFIPTYEAPHKQSSGTGVDSRLQMLKQAIKTNQNFYINDIEIERKGVSYTVDTVTLLREKHHDVQFHFIIGADIVEYLPHWHEIERLLDLVKFIGVGRPGYKMKTDYPIIEADVPLMDISSTDVRRRVKEGQTIKYLVPECVETYIYKRRLYEQK
ncbi:Nicotinate-nucleotide adenylyltransferase [Lentibacillus sp. JNUCC-1]|nr:Nicotinate-nucleotide adenylyltransferase [Lentibacillus sp. JNUCC-1]